MGSQELNPQPRFLSYEETWEDHEMTCGRIIFGRIQSVSMTTMCISSKLSTKNVVETDGEKSIKKTNKSLGMTI